MGLIVSNEILSIYNTVDIVYKGRYGPGQLVSYIRMSLITDGNYVNFGRMDRKNRPSLVKVPYIRILLYR